MCPSVVNKSWNLESWKEITCFSQMTLLASPNLCLQDEEQQLKHCSFAYLTCVTCDYLSCVLMSISHLLNLHLAKMSVWQIKHQIYIVTSLFDTKSQF
jgi:hypothetical protein